MKILNDNDEINKNNKQNNICEHCLNSEPYVCDLIYCEHFNKPTNRQSSCEFYRRKVEEP